MPDSYDEHVKLMFDLQAVALAADVTRVFAFKLSRDVSNRVYPETGVTTGFHIASHHADREDRILDFAKINAYHVSLMPYLLEKLKKTPDGDRRTVLDNTADHLRVADGQLERPQPQAVPAARRGHGGGAIKGNMHMKAPDGTPMANAMLSVLQTLGLRGRELRRQHAAARSERSACGDDCG